MCGIMVTRDPRKLGRINHRGTETNVQAALGLYMEHARLPIQTEEGDGWGQPIDLGHGEYLLYVGEIYNCPEEYKNDVEYLKDLFQFNLIEGILTEANKWDGMWAIVYIRADGSMMCFTDPLGKKQLYYNILGDVCSEIQPLIMDPHGFDPHYRAQVYKWGYNTNERTPWTEIKRVIPGQVAVINSPISSYKKNYYDGFEYYNWNDNIPSGSLRELLYESVERRLLSKNEEISCLLSGGLDSAIIGRILNDLQADCRFYTVENGETGYARRMADYLGVQLTSLNPQYGNDFVEQAFRWNETPVDLGSVLPQHALMAAVPTKIVLTGDGADELFGGYRRQAEYDAQYSDVFEELPYYHLPRLDRASMRYTVELRSPFLSHDVVKYALRLPYSERIAKKHLKDTFRGLIPDEIINRPKLPLKNQRLVADPTQYRKETMDLFYGLW